MADNRKPHQIIDEWNQKHPNTGIEVDVTDDLGKVTRRTTMSCPWDVCGSVVIMVSGIRGGYLLDRCKVV